jgi:signal transduction histidine kinase/CheY-like chemotaxis protein
VGRSIGDLFPVNAATFQEKCRQAFEKGKVQFLSTRRAGDGSAPKRMEHRIFRLPSGRIVCLSDDRTEIQALEERLRQSEKLCAIGQLAGGIAHDFNNQLTAVLGSADLLRMRVSDDRQRQFADMILQAARRSRDLTNQLLAFARRGRYLAVSVNLHAIIEEVVALAERSFPRNITIKRHLRADGAATTGDPTQLQNAFLNLALNARDAMPTGGALTFETEVLTLTNERECSRYEGLSPGSYVRVRVGDTGVGMDKETLKHLYEPFFTTKPTGEGTGLGLAAVYGTVRSHRGGIAVTSEVGKGTTFDLLFPLAGREGLGPEVPRSVGFDRKQGQVLVIDDDEIVCRMTAILLRELGCTPITCNGGARGVAYYREHWQSIDLVILDMIMPEMSGRETFEALKETNPEVNVLLASGHSVDGEAQEILDMGAAAFLQKPFDLQELSEKLSLLLGRSYSTVDEADGGDGSES